MDIDSDIFHSLLSLVLNSKVNLVRTPDKIVLEPFAQYFPYLQPSRYVTVELAAVCSSHFRRLNGSAHPKMSLREKHGRKHASKNMPQCVWGVFRNAARQSMLFKGPDHWEVLQFVYILIVLSLLKCKCLQLDLSMYISILLAMKSLLVSLFYRSTSADTTSIFRPSGDTEIAIACVGWLSYSGLYI